MQPFQTGVLHPFGRAFYLTRMEIERNANSDHDGVHLVAMFGHPAFLFGAAETDENNTWAARVDTFHRSRILLRTQFAKGWRFHARHSQ